MMVDVMLLLLLVVVVTITTNNIHFMAIMQLIPQGSWRPSPVWIREKTL